MFGSMMVFFFFFNDTATTEIYTLSLHDALPIWKCHRRETGTRDRAAGRAAHRATCATPVRCCRADRKSTRLNSSHSQISYAVFCLKKKKKKKEEHVRRPNVKEQVASDASHQVSN